MTNEGLLNLDIQTSSSSGLGRHEAVGSDLSRRPRFQPLGSFNDGDYLEVSLHLHAKSSRPQQLRQHRLEA